MRVRLCSKPYVFKSHALAHPGSVPHIIVYLMLKMAHCGKDHH
jgi:hypothetical protein